MVMYMNLALNGLSQTRNELDFPLHMLDYWVIDIEELENKIELILA